MGDNNNNNRRLLSLADTAANSSNNNTVVTHPHLKDNSPTVKLPVSQLVGRWTRN